MNYTLRTSVWSCLLLCCFHLQAQNVLNCTNINRQLNAGGTVIVQPFDINGGSSGYTNYTIGGQAFVSYTCTDIGMNNVVLIGMDSLGNSDTCMAQISIMDVTAPVAVCQNITLWLNPVSQSVTITSADINNGSTDNCSLASLSINGQAALTFGTQHIGTNMVTLTATDVNGNSANCIAAVTVNGIGLGPVSGRVVLDTNLNCLSDAPETGVLGATIHLQSATRSYYFYSDINGNYAGTIDTGIYIATFSSPIYYSQPCQTTQLLVMDTSYTPQVLDWQLQDHITCSFMNVDMGIPFIRTNGMNNYTVHYCNGGNATAQNAYVDITLDTFINFSAASIPGISLGNNVYRFNLGNVTPGYCDYFSISFTLLSGAYLGQTHCSEAHIYPDSLCVPNLWSGAELDADAQCLNDSIVFTIVNNGADMSSTRSYYVYEDSTLIQMGPVMLLAGQSMSLFVSAQPGKTYRLIAEQESGYPAISGDSVATTFVENCNTVSFPNMSRGFGTNFSNGNSSPMIAVDCHQNVESYDPNDKQAQPEGYGIDHYIYDYTALDYTIHFQNTGTDTAFNIYVLDTLSGYLDPATLQMGAGSHPYIWEMLPDNVLKVRFDNIMLPDSGVNQLTSNGFFKYRILQKSNNPIGTRIENTAAIYFDANPPVLTNTTFHSIGDDFIHTVLSTVKIAETSIPIIGIDFQLFPNPTSGQFSIALSDAQGMVEVSIYNALGQLLRQEQQSAQSRIGVDFEASPGIYFVQLRNENGVVGVRKLRIKN